MSEETFKAPEPDQLAELLPAYDLESFIAQGGMGAVYKAVQRSLDREVAIKILPREFGEDPEFRRSFETEAKAMAKLNHPNLIGVYDFGDIDGMPYIVMEFVNGKSLYHSAWNKVIAPDQAVTLVRAICEGLGHAHEAGVIHRDIKPANILLTQKTEPKIGDFGLAQPVDAKGGGLVMGTPGYAAPELLAKPDTADHRVDIFAVGVILHELITGRRTDPESGEAMQPSPDRNLDVIWKKAVDPNPARRYQTAKAMADALASWKPRPAPAAVAATPPPRQLKPSGAPLVRPPARSSAALSKKPNAALRNLVIFVALVLAAGIAWNVLKSEDPQRDSDKPEVVETEADTTTADTDPEEWVEPEPPTRVETPRESLARLGPALAAGERDELPAGSFRRGQSDYLLIETPMNWHDAAWFAEKHGGHLAIVGDQESVIALSQVAHEGTALWIGAGRSGSSVWVLIDGSRWPLEKSPAGVGKFATIDKLGLVRARPFSELLPFAIQWRRDGSNPGSIERTFATIKESLDTPARRFPPGTFAVGGRRFRIVVRPIDRDEADRLAAIGGGIVAIPATREEADWLERESEGLPASDGLWLGGQRDGEIWRWRSGETWENPRWIEGSAPDTGGSGLVLVPDQGWTNADPAETASGFIIEWSNDSGDAAIPDSGAGN